MPDTNSTTERNARITKDQTGELRHHVGTGNVEEEKKLFAIAVEKGRKRKPDILYTHAKCIEDVRAGLVAMQRSLPKHSYLVGVSEVVGYLCDDKGRIVV